MRFLILVLFAFSFSSSAFAGTKPYPLTARNKADIIRQVKDKLFDGESARWRWPEHVASFGSYCGWVNAKNRMGAYVGWVPYYTIGGVGDGPRSTGVYSIQSVMIAEPDGKGGDTSLVIKFCMADGYDMSGPPPELERR